jgi:hypothetical protein
MVGMALGKSIGVIPFIRTLRSTGCLATVVIFVDDNFINSIEYPLNESLLQY